MRSREPVALGEPGSRLPTVERGALIIIRQFDVADEVDLALAESLQASARTQLSRARATALLLSNPPLAIPLGTQELTLGSRKVNADVLARVFDFGAVSIRMRVTLPAVMRWEELASVVQAAQLEESLTRLARDASQRLVQQLLPAMTKPHTSELFEDYAIVFVERLGDGRTPRSLPPEAIAKLLLGEDQAAALTEGEIAEAIRHRSAYYTDDLFVAGWNVALVAEPRGDTDPIDVLEFANAQLLELRYYDSILDRELGKLYDEVGRRRRRFLSLLRGYGPVLRQAIALLLELAEFVERVENGIKIIGDAYLTRLYGSAVDVFRIQAWERTVTRKQALVQQVYDVLNSEVDTWRDQLIEVTILLLIVGELLLALHVAK